MSNPTPRKTHSVPVIAYPEGVIVGNVRSGKNGKGVTRHVATTRSGQRIGTFDMYREASDALLSWHRKGLDELRTHEIELTDVEPIRVELVEAPSDRAQYGITHLSRFVFRTSRGSSPTRIAVWSNVNRPNPRNGEPVRFGEYGPRDGGNGRYLDPQNKATDDAVSILMTPEASCITNNGTNTGTEASGQMYAPAGTRIAESTELQLVYPDGTEVVFSARFTNNGHGRLDYVRSVTVAPEPFYDGMALGDTPGAEQLPARTDEHQHNVWNHTTVAEIEARDIAGHWSTTDYYGGKVRLAGGLDGLELQAYSALDDRATKIILDRNGIDALIAALQEQRDLIEPIDH